MDSLNTHDPTAYNLRSIYGDFMRTIFGIFFFMLSCFILPVGAQTLQVLTEEDPPYSLTGPDKKPTGYAVEIVAEIQKRIDNKDAIQIYPWARAYDMITRDPWIVLFAMAKTKEREPIFQWVGPIAENGWVFVAKKSSKLKIASLDDAKKLASIGVVRDYAWDKFLTNQGFANLERVSTYVPNVKKLAANRIQAFVSSNLKYKHELSEQGEKPEDYEVLMEFNTLQMYIAHSKQNDKNAVQAWQTAFDAMKKDGTVEKLLKKWIPDARMPGPAKPAST